MDFAIFHEDESELSTARSSQCDGFSLTHMSNGVSVINEALDIPAEHHIGSIGYVFANVLNLASDPKILTLKIIIRQNLIPAVSRR